MIFPDQVVRPTRLQHKKSQLLPVFVAAEKTFQRLDKSGVIHLAIRRSYAHHLAGQIAPIRINLPVHVLHVNRPAVSVVNGQLPAELLQGPDARHGTGLQILGKKISFALPQAK